MTREEVLKAVNAAREAITAYRSQNMDAARTYQETRQNEMIKEASADLVKLGYAIGAAGTPCPRCGGSGRV